MNTRSPKKLKLLLAAALLAYGASGCFMYLSHNVFRTPVHQDPMPSVQRVEELTLILFGDMGQPGTLRDQVLEQIRTEPKDYIIALGDLIYPHPPPCPTGEVLEQDKAFYQERVAGGLQNLGAPVLAVLGNHAYYRGKRSYIDEFFPFVRSPREIGHDDQGRVIDPAACMVDFLGQLPDVHLPALDYGLDFGVAQLAFVDTNHLDDPAQAVVEKTFAPKDGWKILLGHHVLKTYHNKEQEDYVRPWLTQHGIKPDLYANGHAHFLQFGIYNDIPAVTSGSGSKLRERPVCPPNCGEGQIWGESQAGYAILEVSPETLRVRFKNSDGQELYQWEETRELRADASSE